MTMATGGEEISNTTIASGSEIAYDFFCQPCTLDGKHLEAVGICVDCQEHLCEECFKHHTRPSVTRHHRLLGKDELSEEKDLPKQWDRCTERCPLHQDEILKYFCPTHLFLGCSACIILSHRNCEGMEYIPEVSKDIQNTTECKDFNRKIASVTRLSKSVITTAESNIKSAEEFQIQTKDKLRAHRQQLNKALDKLENELDKKVGEIKEEQATAMAGVIDKCNNIITEAQVIAHHIDNLQKNDQNCDMYILMKKSLSSVEALEDKAREAEKATHVKQYKFQANRKLTDSLAEDDAFGKLCLKGLKASHLADIIVKSASDVKECWIVGCTMMPDSRLLVVDHYNKKIKSIDTSAKKLVSEMALSGKPRGITKISDTRVAVTIENLKKIAFIRADPDLNVESDISLGAKCYGIAFKSDKLYVSFENENKVCILDMKGYVLNEIVTDVNGKRLFESPYCLSLSANKEVLYVSNFSLCNASALKLSLDGQVIGKYEDSLLRYPRQAVDDGNGNVYVCSAGTNSIHVINEDFTKVLIILSEKNGLKEPYSVCLSEDGCSLYIGMKSDKIKVFELS